MSIEAIKILASEMAEDLVRNKLERYAETLRSAVSHLGDSEKKEDALNSIAQACHIKAYGDLYLESLPGYEWPKKVSKLRQLCLEQQSGKK
ncbi:MAG: hypothetical protein P1U59_01410 [Alcanivorax sp.]|uniref:hypothetical protein n=1 Tax=Alcanivorax sp. TaxID=1872427 RepID=UPI002605D1D1|nr:hypothetical protein [Alcanivorax sp.]MDF1723141.1 hypothetical protein [Alcanivorax sp.]